MGGVPCRDTRAFFFPERSTTSTAAYRFSGHREILELCLPHVIDRRAALCGFGDEGTQAQAADYLHWVRSVAEAKVHDLGVSELPWWEHANHVDEIADAGRHPSATSHDGRALAEERAEIELTEFAFRFKTASGRTIDDLASRGRSPELIRGRVEFVTLALLRYGLRGCDVAALLDKHGNSVTLWLNKGLRLERSDPEFKRRLDRLDAAISRLD